MRMKIKRIIILFNIFIFILILSSCNNENKTIDDRPKDETEEKEEIKPFEIESTFDMSLYKGGIKTVSYKYSDSYFEKEEYNNDLMKASFVSACTSDDISISDDVTYLHKKFFTEIGFSNFYYNPYYFENTNINNIGMLFASKKIYKNKEEYTIIAASLRGFDYYFEWASNFIIGKTGDHKGFKNAAILFLNELNNYAEKINSKNTILWISGYSRAGAVANIATAYIDNYLYYKNNNVWLSEEYKIDKLNFDVKLNDIYCYTYEAPNGAEITNANLLKDATKNIYNVVNETDIVTMVVPNSLGLTKYGTIHSYTILEPELLSRVNEFFKEGYNVEINKYRFSFSEKEDDVLVVKAGGLNLYAHKLDEKINVKEFFENQIDTLVDLFKTRNNYSEIIDILLEEFFTKAYTLSVEEKDILLNNLINNFKDSALQALLMSSKFKSIVVEAFESVNLELSEEAKNSLISLHNVLKTFINNELKADSDGYFGENVATIYLNIKEFIINHYYTFLYSVICCME